METGDVRRYTLFSPAILLKKFLRVLSGEPKPTRQERKGKVTLDDEEQEAALRDIEECMMHGGEEEEETSGSELSD